MSSQGCTCSMLPSGALCVDCPLISGCRFTGRATRSTASHPRVALRSTASNPCVPGGVCQSLGLKNRTWRTNVGAWRVNDNGQEYQSQSKSDYDVKLLQVASWIMANVMCLRPLMLHQRSCRRCPLQAWASNDDVSIVTTHNKMTATAVVFAIRHSQCSQHDAEHKYRPRTTAYLKSKPYARSQPATTSQSLPTTSQPWQHWPPQ